MPQLFNDIVDSFLHLATVFYPDAAHLGAVNLVHRETSTPLTVGVHKALIQTLGFRGKKVLSTYLDAKIMAEDNGIGPLARRTCLTIFQRHLLLSTYIMETVGGSDRNR
jgi:hypothetical protein